MLQAIAQLLEQSHLVKVNAHAAPILVRLRVQDAEELHVLLFGRRDDAPRLHRIARVHRAAGIKAVCAELVREIDGSADLADIEPSRRKVDLDRHARRTQVLRALDDGVEFAEHPHPVERRARRPVEAHLHGLHAELTQALAVLRVEVVTVGFDLELPPVRAGVLDHSEELRMHHRLAARERQIRDVLVNELVDDGEHFVVSQLIVKGLARPALLDAVQACEVAFVGDLPRDVEGRRKIVAGCRGHGGAGAPCSSFAAVIHPSGPVGAMWQ